jgi:LysR family transcriptional regulator, hydrogen peroxide-inducible genes activator
VQRAPHPFTLRQLQYVVAVADLLSFRRAAEECGVSQPSLSAQIAQLEDMLSVKLFERDARGVLLTPAGRELVAAARRVLLDAGDLADAARRNSDPLAGVLRVGVIPTVSPYLLPSVAAPLREAYPRLTLRWVEEKTPSLVSALAAGELDAAILAGPVEGDLDSELIANDPFVLAVPAGHRLAESTEPAPASAIRGEPVLLLDEGHCFREQALAFCSARRAQELDFRATSLSTLVQMVASGAGITLLPSLAVPTEARRADVHVRPFADPAPSRTLLLAWRRTSPLAGTLRQIASTLREAIAPQAPARQSSPRRKA